jgi:hypothetical protein
LQFISQTSWAFAVQACEELGTLSKSPKLLEPAQPHTTPLFAAEAAQSQKKCAARETRSAQQPSYKRMTTIDKVTENSPLLATPKLDDTDLF